MEEAENEKSVQELALLELSKNARILQRQLKIMKGLQLSMDEQVVAKKVIHALEKEFQAFRI